MRRCQTGNENDATRKTARNASGTPCIVRRGSPDASASSRWFPAAPGFHRYPPGRRGTTAGGTGLRVRRFHLRRTAVFDPSVGEWSEGPELPGEVMEGFSTSCCAAGRRLYVSTSSGRVLRLSADGQVWEEAGKLRNGRFFHQLLPIDECWLLAVAGPAWSGVSLRPSRPCRPANDHGQAVMSYSIPGVTWRDAYSVVISFTSCGSTKR